MRTGKPPAPWRRKKHRSPSLVAISVLVVLFASAGAYALWRARPQPLPWHSVGADRIVTPAFDIADSATRDAARALSTGTLNAYRGRWLGAECRSEAPSNVEVYVLARDGVGEPAKTWPWVASRIVVELSQGGTATHEQFTSGNEVPIARSSRVFDEADADRFRDLLLDGGFTRMAPASDEGWRCHREVVTLEACVRGRYYGVVRGNCRNPAVEPSLFALAAEIEAFALDGLAEKP